MSTSFKPSPEFQVLTPRLRIIHFDADSPFHSAFLCRLWNTEDFIASCGKTGINTPEQAARYWRERAYAEFERNGYGKYLVALRNGASDESGGEKESAGRDNYNETTAASGEKLVGLVSLMRGEPPNAYSAPDIGYTILPEESGKGYATEAAKALIEYARRELGVDAVVGFCDANDGRSRRVLEKIGLQDRGVRKLRVFGGKLSAVFASEGMGRDLTIYGIDD